MRTLFALLIVACGAPHSEAPSVEPAPPIAEHETPVVDIHEWGLIDVDLATGVAELSAGPGRSSVPVIMRKPVLYLHILDGNLQRLTVRARVPGGAILEHWPPAQLTPEMVTWDLALTRGVCGPARGPVRRETIAPACNSTDGFCETPELPRYATDDHDCMDVSGTQANLLFYRASVAADRLPLRIVRNPDGTVSVTGTTDGWDRPREMLRIQDNVLARASMPRNGETITIPVASAPIDPAAERAVLASTLDELGLTPSEANAFLNAWSDELFDAQATRRRFRDLSPADVVIYWLAPSDVNRFAVIDASPSSIQLSRAFMVRVTMPPR